MMLNELVQEVRQWFDNRETRIGLLLLLVGATAIGGWQWYNATKLRQRQEAQRALANVLDDVAKAQEGPIFLGRCWGGYC